MARIRIGISGWRYITHMRKRFLDTSFIDMLRAHNIALVVAETARRWPMTHDVTADFV